MNRVDLYGVVNFFGDHLMMKFAVAGTLYYKLIVQYLASYGYNPSLVIDGTNSNILSYKEIIKEKNRAFNMCKLSKYTF